MYTCGLFESSNVQNLNPVCPLLPPYVHIRKITDTNSNFLLHGFHGPCDYTGGSRKECLLILSCPSRGSYKRYTYTQYGRMCDAYMAMVDCGVWFLSKGGSSERGSGIQERGWKWGRESGRGGKPVWIWFWEQALSDPRDWPAQRTGLKSCSVHIFLMCAYLTFHVKSHATLMYRYPCNFNVLAWWVHIYVWVWWFFTAAYIHL